MSHRILPTISFFLPHSLDCWSISLPRCRPLQPVYVTLIMLCVIKDRFAIDKPTKHRIYIESTTNTLSYSTQTDVPKLFGIYNIYCIGVYWTMGDIIIIVVVVVIGGTDRHCLCSPLPSTHRQSLIQSMCRRSVLGFSIDSEHTQHKPDYIFQTSSDSTKL